MSFNARADVVLARRAANQYGVFSRDQALAVGLSRQQIVARLRSGYWQALLPSVYRFTAAPASDAQAVWAAVLWAGPDAVVSHRSAARMWELDVGTPVSPEILVPMRRAPRARGVRVHRTLALPPRDVARRDGLPLTRPERTIVDLAAVLSDEDLEVAFESARGARLVTASSVRRKLRELGPLGRAGTAALGRMLVALEDGAPSQSRLEVKAARLLRASGLPPAVRQYPVAIGRNRYHLDFAWPDRKVTLECDGRRTHEPAFQRDRTRWTAIAAAGWRVLIVTWDDVVRRPELVVTRVADALSNAG